QRVLGACQPARQLRAPPGRRGAGLRGGQSRRPLVERRKEARSDFLARVAPVAALQQGRRRGRGGRPGPGHGGGAGAGGGRGGAGGRSGAASFTCFCRSCHCCRTSGFIDLTTSSPLARTCLSTMYAICCSSGERRSAGRSNISWYSFGKRRLRLSRKRLRYGS